MGKKNNKSAKQFETNLPEIAKRHNIRVSQPYGYYPDDVDKIILKYETEINSLLEQNRTAKLEVVEAKKETNLVKLELEKCNKELNACKDEFAKFKMEVSLMEIPDTSTEEDFVMMSSGISSITGQVNDQILPKEKEIKHTNLNPVMADKPSENPMFSNLIKPKKGN